MSDLLRVRTSASSTAGVDADQGDLSVRGSELDASGDHAGQLVADQ